MDTHEPYIEAWADPPWLTKSVDAQQALETLEAKDRGRRWRIGFLVLLRRDYTERKVTLKKMKAAAKRFDGAAEQVLDTTASLLPHTERMTALEDADEIREAAERLQVPKDSLQLGLGQVPLHLKAVTLTLKRELTLIERNALRQVLKARLVCEAKGPTPHDFHDMEVSALINAALDGLLNGDYSADAHKNWRANHKALLQTTGRRELPSDIEYLFHPTWEIKSEKAFIEYFEDEIETAREEVRRADEKTRAAEEWQAVLDEVTDEAHTPRK